MLIIVCCCFWIRYGFVVTRLLLIHHHLPIFILNPLLCFFAPAPEAKIIICSMHQAVCYKCHCHWIESMSFTLYLFLYNFQLWLQFQKNPTKVIKAVSKNKLFGCNRIKSLSAFFFSCCWSIISLTDWIGLWLL